MKRTDYSSSILLDAPEWNRALAPASWQWALVVPALVNGILEDVQKWDHVVFVAEDEWKLMEAKGLRNFIRTEWNWIPVTVFDNHNHALYFWYEARANGLIRDGATLVHIDEHSDLWENENAFAKPDSFDLSKVFGFTNYCCNVGNYIKPAMKEGLVGEMVRIEGEWELLRERERIVSKNSILNLDLDFFAPELDDIPFDLKKEVILHFARQASLITIASSPFFIEQERAIGFLRKVFG